jgi:hypothetical protein
VSSSHQLLGTLNVLKCFVINAAWLQALFVPLNQERPSPFHCCRAGLD